MKMVTQKYVVLGGIVAFLILGTACEQKKSPPPSTPLSQHPGQQPPPNSAKEAAPYKETALEILGKDALNPQGHFSQIKGIKLKDGDLVFTSAGVDPYFQLPTLPKMPRGAKVIVELTLPKKQMVQFFFQEIGKPEFSEKNSIIVVGDAGRQTIEWNLTAPLNGNFRLDPGTNSGEYSIHKIHFVY
jgi:hypothetical protein